MRLTKLSDGKILVNDFGEINLALTLDCGQAFRWVKTSENEYEGVAYGKYARIKQTFDGLVFSSSNEDDIKNVWSRYFGFDCDCQEIISQLCEDALIYKAYKKYGVIRILCQEPWETLCSFIISSCNNIQRIKGIISRLCAAFGEKTGVGHSFPSALTLAKKTAEDLNFLKAGYRAPYIIDAAKKVNGGEINLDMIKTMTEKEAEKELMKIKGVGKKVADCTMLFSLGFTDVYPVDVHIKRATEKYYPNGLPLNFKPYSGLAQQYIYHFQRMGEAFAAM